VMYVLGCDADRAMNLLRHLSQRTNRKLSDLAEALVRSRGRGAEAQLVQLARQLEYPTAVAGPSRDHGPVRAARRSHPGCPP
jgi:hypothetical protein